MLFGALPPPPPALPRFAIAPVCSVVMFCSGLASRSRFSNMLPLVVRVVVPLGDFVPADADCCFSLLYVALLANVRPPIPGPSLIVFVVPVAVSRLVFFCVPVVAFVSSNGNVCTLRNSVPRSLRTASKAGELRRCSTEFVAIVAGAVVLPPVAAEDVIGSADICLGMCAITCSRRIDPALTFICAGEKVKCDLC